MEIDVQKEPLNQISPAQRMLSSIHFLNRSLWIVFWSVAGILISTIHFENFYYKHDAPKYLVLDLVLAIYLAIKMPSLKMFTLNACHYLVISFLLICAFSLAWAPNVWAGALMLGRYSMMALALYCLIKDFRDPRHKHLLLIVVATSAIAFFLTLFVERYLLKLPYNNGSYSPLGFINHAGHSFVIWIPVLAAGVFACKSYTRYVCLGLAALAIWFLTESAIRASIYGLLIAAAVLALYLAFLNRRDIWKPIIIILAIAVSILGVQQLSERGEHLASKIARSTDVGDLDRASSNRIKLFKNTISMIGKEPLGVGLGNFEYIHPLYAKPGEKGQSSPNVDERRILRTPHNYVLKITSEIGWLGGLLALCLGGVWLLFALKGLGRSGRIGVFYCMATIAVLFNAQLSAVFSHPSSLFFSLLLMAGIAGQTPEDFSAKLKKCIFRIRPIHKLLVTAAICSVSLLSLASFNSQYYAYRGKLQADSLMLQRAARFFPGNERAYYDLAVIQFEQDRDTEAAIISMHRFLELYPYHISGRFKLAQWLYRDQQYRSVQTELERVLRYYPSFKAARSLHKQAGAKLRKQNQRSR